MSSSTIAQHLTARRSAIALRPYQHDALAAIDEAADRGVRRLLVALPTGTGKTVIFAETIRRRGGRALVLAHRDELISQAVAKLMTVDPSVRVGIVKANRDEHDAPITVASVQTLARTSRLARLSVPYHTVVVDEAHHATADSYRRILEHVGSFREDGPLTLGVTATPDRGDGQPLGAVWQEIVFSRDILPMMQDGYLADLRALQIRVAVDFDRVRMCAGDFVPSELDGTLRRVQAPRQVVTAYRGHAAGRKALVFTPSVALAHEMAAEFRAAGILAEALDGQLSSDMRRAVLHRLHDGDTMVVCNCAVLTEGFDEPSIDCIVVARPTASRALYVQMIGRGTRPYPGKGDCLVLDLVGSTTRHQLMTAATLFGLPARELAARSVTQAIACRKAIEETRATRGRLVAQTVDLFAGRRFNWVASQPDRFALSLPDRTLLVLTTADHRTWQVDSFGPDRQRRTLASGLDLQYAQGTAEDFARRCGAGRLVDRQAAWRLAPATANQLEALRRWGIQVPPAITKGQASDLLVAAAARCA